MWCWRPNSAAAWWWHPKTCSAIPIICATNSSNSRSSPWRRADWAWCRCMAPAQARGILLLGASGAGKSTLALHSLLQGMDFLAEDAVFVQPESMLATGVANYLHVRADALRFVSDEATRHWISEAPVIRRRSGVGKFEADLRQGHGRLAAVPLELVGAVFVSAQPADDPDVLLSTIPPREIADRLRADQAYASGQPGWHRFEQQMMQLGAHRLRRGRHPRDAATALSRLLG